MAPVYTHPPSREAQIPALHTGTPTLTAALQLGHRDRAVQAGPGAPPTCLCRASSPSSSWSFLSSCHFSFSYCSRWRSISAFLSLAKTRASRGAPLNGAQRTRRREPCECEALCFCRGGISRTQRAAPTPEPAQQQSLQPPGPALRLESKSDVSVRGLTPPTEPHGPGPQCPFTRMGNGLMSASATTTGEQ